MNVFRQESGRMKPLAMCRWLWVLLLPWVSSCSPRVALHGVLDPPETRAPAGSANPRLENSVVWVELADTTLAAQYPKVAGTSLTFTHSGVTPAVAVVGVGTTIQIRNSDRLFHRPFSRSPTVNLTARPLRPGSSVRVKAQSTGPLQIFCELHANEAASVLVLGRVAWTRADARGAFTLPALPPGHYVLHAWHPWHGECQLPLVIEPSGQLAVEMKF